MAKELKHYFSKAELLTQLCKYRIAAANKANENQFFNNLSTTQQKTKNRKELYEMFPPRSIWIRLCPKERRKYQKNYNRIARVELYSTVKREEERALSGTKPLWLIKLHEFIETTRFKALEDTTFQIPRPKVIALPKEKGSKEYRPICLYALMDHLIIGQTAKYLTHTFDPLFSDSSYAFRSKSGSVKNFNHHEAVKGILKFKKENATIFAAECDIQKFYDSVNHTRLRSLYRELVIRKLNAGVVVSVRAHQLFHSYLDSFDFKYDVHDKEHKILGKSKKAAGCNIPWVPQDGLTSLGSDISIHRIGVPQGGALSCLIANIMLHFVDEKVLSSGSEHIYYARFCDDMILLGSENELICHKLEVYQKALRDVKLIPHTPKPVGRYSRSFWESKSKNTYLWSSRALGGVPYLAFVGYEIRFDGFMRVRKKSLRKEMQKQVAIIDKVISVTKPTGLRKRKIVVLTRVEQKLVSMSVGKPIGGHSMNKMCWTSGFWLCHENPKYFGAFRKLDRKRHLQLIRLRKKLKTVAVVKPRKGKAEVSRPKYYGYPFSYFKNMK